MPEGVSRATYYRDLLLEVNIATAIQEGELGVNVGTRKWVRCPDLNRDPLRPTVKVRNFRMVAVGCHILGAGALSI